VPVFQNAKAYDSGGAFVSSLSSTGVADEFDVGTGPSTGVIVRVISHTGSGGGAITTFVIGGVALTALPQRSLAGFNANERLFYGVGLSLRGAQPWTATVGSATKIAVQIFAARGAVRFSAGPSMAVLSNTLNLAITTDANSIQVGMLTSNLDSGSLVAAGNSQQRLNRAGNFYQDFIITDGPSDTSMDAQVTGSVFTSSYLGMIVNLQGNVVRLPSWVPAAGEVATLTVSNGKLANSFISQCAPYFEPFYFAKTASTYGGCFKNPYWGDYGCALFFSGGHANTNDNTVTIAEYGSSAVRFKRVCDPTPWFGTGTDDVTRGNNSADVAGPQAFLDWTGTPGTSALNYGVSTIDGKPGSAHTYGSGDFVGPDAGGAANGTYLRVWTPAINRANMKGAVSALALDFPDTTSSSASRTWRKQSLSRVDEAGFGGAAPVLTQIVPAQRRVYIVCNGNALIRWFDIASGTYVTGTGRGFSYDQADGFDGGTMFHVPSRGLLLCVYRRAGFVEVQWMDVTVAQPTLGGTAILSMALPVPDPWGAATWCPDNNRVIVGGITGDNSAVYELDIPSALSSTWTVTRAPFGAGQTLPAMSNASEFKRFHYDEKIRAIFYFEWAKRPDQGEDVAYVYRPRST